MPVEPWPCCTQCTMVRCGTQVVSGLFGCWLTVLQTWSSQSADQLSHNNADSLVVQIQLRLEQFRKLPALFNCNCNFPCFISVWLLLCLLGCWTSSSISLPAGVAGLVLVCIVVRQFDYDTPGSPFNCQYLLLQIFIKLTILLDDMLRGSPEYRFLYNLY